MKQLLMPRLKNYLTVPPSATKAFELTGKNAGIITAKRP